MSDYKVQRVEYQILQDGSIKDGSESNHIILGLNDQNTLLIHELDISDVSFENAMKAILLAHTKFMSLYTAPAFSSELETKDETGVIERLSNMPGRSIVRKEPADQKN